MKTVMCGLTIQPGFFRVRMCRGGPLVGAAIYFRPPNDPETHEPMDRSWMWETWINGECIGASPDPWAAQVEKVALYHKGEIAEAEYDYLIADKEWCEQYAPNDPMANPYQPLPKAQKPNAGPKADLRKLPSLF